MPTRITQLETDDGSGVVLRVEGSLTLIDAELLERICSDLRAEVSGTITLDLADLNFLDSEGASVLRRLKDLGVEFEGVHVFIQKVIEEAERAEANGRSPEVGSF